MHAVRNVPAFEGNGRPMCKGRPPDKSWLSFPMTIRLRRHKTHGRGWQAAK